MSKKYSLFLLVLLSFIFSNCSNFQKVQKSTEWEVKYNAALKYYERKDYYRAGMLFEELVPIMRGKKEAELIEFYLAYCNYHQSNLVLSAENFKSFFETYARSQFAEEAMYMYAFSLYEDSPNYNLDQTNTIDAIDAMQNFINHYPESKFVDKSNTILLELRHKLEKKDYESAKMYHKIQNYKSAVIAFDNFQKNFPDSPYNEEVAFLKIESSYTYARLSVESKKEERFKSVIDYYEKFIDKFPDSRYLRQAENYYKNSLEEVSQLAKK